MQVQTRVKKAHLGIVTALVFSHDSRLFSFYFQSFIIYWLKSWLILSDLIISFRWWHAVYDVVHVLRALLSSSFDSTARVTTIETRKSNGRPRLYPSLLYCFVFLPESYVSVLLLLPQALVRGLLFWLLYLLFWYISRSRSKPSKKDSDYLGNLSCDHGKGSKLHDLLLC